MKKADAINYFGSAAELARKLNISEAAVSQWGDTIPQGRAYQTPGTPLAEIPSVQRATDAAKDDPAKAQPGKA